MTTRTPPVPHFPWKLGLAALCGITIGVAGGALEHHLIPPSGGLAGLSRGGLTVSRVEVTLAHTSVAPGDQFSGTVNVILDDGVRAIDRVEATVIPTAPGPRPTLARIVLRADPTSPARLSFTWDQTKIDGNRLPAGAYALYVDARLTRDPGDARPPYASTVSPFVVR